MQIIAAPRAFAVMWNQWLVPSPLCNCIGLMVPLSRAYRTIRSFGEFVICAVVSRSKSCTWILYIWKTGMTSTDFPSNNVRSEEHTSELQSRLHLVCRLLLEKKNPNSFNRVRHSEPTAT